jgi:hypothetical protein
MASTPTSGSIPPSLGSIAVVIAARILIVIFIFPFSFAATIEMTRGFAVVAYPAAYGDSGVMTFLVDQNGMVLQKDLGKTTDQIASAMTEFNPDKTWTVVE